MMDRLLKCPSCGAYGIKPECTCGSIRVSPLPPKYSPEDRYGQYRRRAKELLGNEGIEPKGPGA